MRGSQPSSRRDMRSRFQHQLFSTDPVRGRGAHCVKGPATANARPDGNQEIRVAHQRLIAQIVSERAQRAGAIHYVEIACLVQQARKSGQAGGRSRRLAWTALRE